jgi:hypothetical protein
VLHEVAVPRVSRAPLLPVNKPDGAPRPQALAPARRDDEAIVEQARKSLLDALRSDPPSFASRLVSRVRGARDATTLIDLVLEAERDVERHRRSQAGLRSLEQARDLLGLGNTVVAEDSRPSAWLDSE